MFLDYVEFGIIERSVIEIYIDWNWNYGVFGIVGCIVIYNIVDYKRFVIWLWDIDFCDFYVDWKLGICFNF